MEVAIIFIPPNLLHKKSWELIMGDLENHFGDDASLDEKTNQDILTFLLKNSAETSTNKASWNFLNSIGDKDIIALSKTTYWERKHKKIPKEVFKNEKVKSVANCKACHSDSEKELIENGEDDYKKYKQSYKNLDYLNLDEKQVKAIKNILLELKDEYKEFYEFKDDIEDDIEDLIEESNFDENLYIQKSMEIKKKATILEAKRIKKILEILNEKQRDKFADHFKEWIIE